MRDGAEGHRDAPPDFVGVAAQRCGTTWWYDLIAAHPAVHQPSDDPKEHHFFDEFCRRPFGDDDVGRYHAGFQRPDGMLAGEWTPRYAYDFWTPGLLRRAAPDARLLFMIRDPVERYRSGVVHTDSLRPPGSGLDLATASMEAVHRGRYAEQLRRLLEQFPPEQVLVLQYERCSADPEGELRRTYRFLDLDDQAIPADVRAPRGTSSALAKDPLPEAVRQGLVSYLEDDVRELPTIAPHIDLEQWTNFTHCSPRRPRRRWWRGKP